MTSQPATEPVSVRDALPVMLELMGTLTTSVCGEHTHEADMYGVSGSAWPCERVLLAVHNLSR